MNSSVVRHSAFTHLSRFDFWLDSSLRMLVIFSTVYARSSLSAYLEFDPASVVYIMCSCHLVYHLKEKKSRADRITKIEVIPMFTCLSKPINPRVQLSRAWAWPVLYIGKHLNLNLTQMKPKHTWPELDPICKFPTYVQSGLNRIDSVRSDTNMVQCGNKNKKDQRIRVYKRGCLVLFCFFALVFFFFFF